MRTQPTGVALLVTFAAASAATGGTTLDDNVDDPCPVLEARVTETRSLLGPLDALIHQLDYYAAGQIRLADAALDYSESAGHGALHTQTIARIAELREQQEQIRGLLSELESQMNRLCYAP